MPPGPTTIYANVVNMKVTGRELVFEFGAHFPDRPGAGPPSDLQPDVRVVLPREAVQVIVSALGQAIAQEQKAQAEIAKQRPGFQPPSGPPAKGQP